MPKGGVDPVEQHAEEGGELPLERRRVEDGEVGARRVGDAGPVPLDVAGPLEDLLRQRARGVVVGAEKRQPGPGMARRDPHEELEVVLEDERVDRLGRCENDPRARVPETDPEEQEAFLVQGEPSGLGSSSWSSVRDGTTIEV